MIYDVRVSVDERLLRLAERYEGILMAAVGDAQQRGIEEWAKIAGRRLHTTAAVYARGLGQPQSIELPTATPSGVAAAIVLVGEFPTMLELGAPAYDMKPALLASPKAHTSYPSASAMKRGAKPRRWIVVPFRHRVTEGTSGVAVGGALAPRDIRATMRKLPRSSDYGPRTMRQVKAAADLRALPVRTKAQIGGMTAPYTHTASIYAGMQRQGARGHEQYMTFRTVSDKSNPNSWWHPGLTGIHAAKDAAPRIEAALRAFVEAALDDVE